MVVMFSGESKNTVEKGHNAWSGWVQYRTQGFSMKIVLKNRNIQMKNKKKISPFLITIKYLRSFEFWRISDSEKSSIDCFKYL